MHKRQLLRTAESVSRSHPDKVCDQISDAILDACLEQDPFTRSAIEVMGSHGHIIVGGELTTNAFVDIEEIALRIYSECGYQDNVEISASIDQQSTEIGIGVDQDGAGDQGVMVGYATRETDEMIPLELLLARMITKQMGNRDAKAQITLSEHNQVSNIITSVCNGDELDLEKIVTEVCKDHLPDNWKDLWYQNPNGSWTIGGFAADAGLTGRKIVIDAYGPQVPVGGGAFSGKDATKVDRSGAYMARKIAVDLIRQKGAQEALVTLAYSIGVPEPTMAIAKIDGIIESITGYDLRPAAIIEQLDLRKPKFYQTAQHGHFGNGFDWDK